MLANGLQTFNDVQIIEALLFYAIPNGDTNPIAHRLINRFGSICGVLEANYHELREIKGIGENAAMLIRFCQQLSGRYLQSLSFDDSESMLIKDTDGLRRYFEGVFLGMHDEQIRAMVLDDKLCMVRENVILEGTIGKVELSARRVADFVIRNGCNRIILAHNHPKGMAIPSRADLITTKKIVTLLKEFEITMVDHIIVGRTGSMSLRASMHAPGIWEEMREEIEKK